MTEEDKKEAKLLMYLKKKRLKLEGKRDRQYKRMLMIFTKHKKRRAKIPGDHSKETPSATHETSTREHPSTSSLMLKQ